MDQVEIPEYTIQDKWDADFEVLHKHLDDGWIVQSTRLSENYDLEQFKKRLGEPNREWLLLGAVTPDGEFRLYSEEQSFELEAGWNVLYFAPAPRDEAAANRETRSNAETRPGESGFSAVTP